MADFAIFADDRNAQAWLRRLQRKVSEVKGGKAAFAALCSAVVFKDVIEHFDEERGSEGKWAKWSAAYTKHMNSIGKGGNKILQDTGKMRNALTPIRAGRGYKNVSDGILWFNKVGYSGRHDRGEGQTKRDFMWLGKAALEDIEKVTLAFILDDEE